MRLSCFIALWSWSSDWSFVRFTSDIPDCFPGTVQSPIVLKRKLCCINMTKRFSICISAEFFLLLNISQWKPLLKSMNTQSTWKRNKQKIFHEHDRKMKLAWYWQIVITWLRHDCEWRGRRGKRNTFSRNN